MGGGTDGTVLWRRWLPVALLMLGLLAVGAGCGGGGASTHGPVDVEPGPTSSVRRAEQPREPPGWKTLTYAELALQVPRRWAPQSYSGACSNFRRTDFVDGVLSGVPGGGPVGEAPCGVTTPSSDYLWVLPYFGKAPSRARETEVNGESVWTPRDRQGFEAYVVPALRVRLIGRGRMVRRIASTISEAPIAVAAAASYPTTVPRAWRKVSFDGLSVHVPAAWPARRLGAGPVPGSCNAGAFSTPVALYGPSTGGTFDCGASTLAGPEMPGNGVWFERLSSKFGPPYTTEGTRALPFRAGSGRLVFPTGVPLGTSNYLEVVVRAHDHTYVIEAGVGAGAAVAEEIVSSISIGA